MVLCSRGLYLGAQSKISEKLMKRAKKNSNFNRDCIKKSQNCLKISIICWFFAKISKILVACLYSLYSKSYRFIPSLLQIVLDFREILWIFPDHSRSYLWNSSTLSRFFDIFFKFLFYYCSIAICIERNFKKFKNFRRKFIYFVKLL